MTTSTRGDFRCKLPYELVETVLNNSDISTFRSCSLVCRSWLPRCRSQLFANFEVKPERCVQLATVMSSDNCTIPGYIRILTFNIDTQLVSLPGSKGGDGSGDENLRYIDFIYMICRRLKDRVQMLRKLRIISYHSNLLSDFNSAPFLKSMVNLASEFSVSFGHVIELDLQLAREEPRIFIPFICSFTCVESLNMNSGFFYSQDLNHILLTSYHLPPSLQILSLRGGYGGFNVDGLEHFYRWLRAQCPIQVSQLSIFRVSVDGDEISPDPDIGPLLARCQELRFLHIGMDSWYVVETDTVFYDLSAPRRLERLVISARNLVQSNIDSALLTIVWKMINTLTSPCLRCITLNVSGSGFRVLKGEWNALDTLLASSKFASVTVEPVVPFSDLTLANGTEDQDLLITREGFTRCDEQGRLSVVQAPFVMRTRIMRDEGGDGEDFPDEEVIDWVCEGLWRV
ncbi:hypothetical protein V5O48_012992 [Marasmius crinis-equi]|uniref:F-box domain-containing protein n=1 Tax=Marasmius crinis-equi TaxID=585013 RepID=A0ABR3F1A7_9AGAR